MALPPVEIGRRLRSLREQLGTSVEDFAAALGADVATVARLEAGTLEPLPGDYILLAARLLKTDFRYFISTELDDVEAQTREVFRALNQPSPSDRLAIRRFLQYCTGESELEQLLSLRRPELPPNYPRPDSSERLHKDQGARAARAERERLLLGNLPVENIFAVLRSQGVRLLRHRLQASDLSGLTALHPRAGVCVLVNFEEDLYRQFFSAAHEYGHVLFDRQALRDQGCVVSYRFSKGELVEIRANAFAAEFLLPLAALDRYARPHDTEELKQRIERIARDYRVNAETVAIRLKEAGWMTERTLESFRQVRPVTIPRQDKLDPDIPTGLSAVQITRRSRASEQGISSYYLELLRRGLAEEAISFGRCAELLDLNTVQAAEFVREVGLAT